MINPKITWSLAQRSLNWSKRQSSLIMRVRKNLCITMSSLSNLTNKKSKAASSPEYWMHTFSRLLLSKFHNNLLSFTAVYQKRKFYWLLSCIGFILLMIISANVFIRNYKIRNQLRLYLPEFIIRYENSSIVTQQKQYDETIQILLSRKVWKTFSVT
jgi:hypothetical protein